MVEEDLICSVSDLVTTATCELLEQVDQSGYSYLDSGTDTG